MDHHVLHLAREHRVSVLTDLTSAPGRTVVFTRTKHGAKALTRQLNSNGVPTVELHGNLSQNARTRNMEAFHSGKATTLVATDIAARGIHVDDVALVVHADPPVEHKAYLHRSGRTARAGAKGTVITLMTDEQVRDVRDLTRAAGIKPTTTKINGAEPPAPRRARSRRAVAARAASSPRRPFEGNRGGGGGGGGRRSGGGGGGGGRRSGGGGRSGGQAKSGGAAQVRRPPSPVAGEVRLRQVRSAARVAPTRTSTPSAGGGQSRHSSASFSSGRR